MMKNVYFILSIAMITLAQCTGSKQDKSETKPYYVRMADSEIQRNPESWMVDFSKNIKWNYTHGLELQAMIQASEKSGNEKYYNYAENYADTMV
ncbi:MAG: glycoside hydrolase family 88 protein, partial [Proteiniphilum sp.]